MTKRLYKSNTNKVISGVCGGLGEYFNFDPSIIRVIWVLIIVFTAGLGGTFAYIICAIVLPNKPYDVPHDGFHGSDPNQNNGQNNHWQ